MNLLVAAAIAVQALAPSCEPPGAPPGWQHWPVVKVSTRLMLAHVGPPVTLYFVRHERGDRAVLAGWSESRLVFFDKEPDENLPMLHDASVIDAAGLLADPRPKCEWTHTWSGR